MYQLIIVDDEEIIREGLVKHIDWRELGFEVAGEFEDGMDAIAYMQEHHVDVVFTDVQMFQISGIELAKYVHEHYPCTKVVELSNYREFQYIKESMRYDVCDYILKPINPEEIMDVFSKIRKGLKDAEKQKEKDTYVFSFYETEEYKQTQEINMLLVNSVLHPDHKAFDTNFEKWKKKVEPFPAQAISNIVLNLFELIYQYFLERGIRPTARLSRAVVMEQLDGLSNEVLFDKTKEILQEFCVVVLGQRQVGQKNAIELAKEYIDQHYRERLSVSDIAEQVFLNPSYLSREFKSQMNMNVTEYILKCRMEAAFRYIKIGTYTAKEVGQLVGYHNTRYFHQVFKEYTGYTIKQYQKIASKNADQ